VSRAEPGQFRVYPQVPLTVVGCELYRIARPTPDLKYLETVVAAAQKAGWKTEVLPRNRVRLPSDGG
jgi:hypothetical protein